MRYLNRFCQTIVDAEYYLILDTETTGLNDGEICQLAVIDCTGKIMLDTFVKTKNPIPLQATSIHGITDTMVKDAPTWCEISPKLEDLLRDNLVVIYNAVYDRKMMHKSAECWELPKVDWKSFVRFECAMEAYAEHYGAWNDYHGSYRWQKLSVAAASESVLVENAHNALGDCLMTLGVVTAMIKSNRWTIKS